MSTCERRDGDLALHVRGDLPEPGRRELVAHLELCSRCRAVLTDLAEIQGTLRSLAEEPLPDSALTAILTRVLATAEPGAAGARRRVPWWLATAAAIVGFGIAVGWLATTWSAHSRLPVEPSDVSRSPAPPPAEAVAPPPVEAVEPAPPDHTPEDSDSPTRTAAGDEGTKWRRPSSSSPAEATLPAEPAATNGSDPAREAASDLTPEEADQLARAVLAMARIEDLGVSGEEADETEDAVPGSDPPPTGGIVQWTLSDPDVVIYWQLDSKGDES